MSPQEAALVQAELAALRKRAETAEQRAETAETQCERYKRERDASRAILTRVRTSLSETVNDPGDGGEP